MDNNVVGTAVFKLKLDTSDLPNQIKGIQTSISTSMGKGVEQTASLTEGIANLTLGINTLKQAFSGLTSGLSIIGNLTDSFNKYEASMNGVASVARATGNSVSESMQVVKDATANGLISKADAAAAVKNLELYGLSADQAAKMIKVMTDAAVYNRQETYSLSEAVRVTTEGIRMENSVLSDAGGITKNIAKMHEEYAAQLGKSATSLTDTEKAQAVYNGVLAEGGIYAGDAEDYTSTLAGAQDKLGTAVDTLKTNLGSLFDKFSPIIDGVADWLNQNQELVVGILSFVGVIAGAAGLISVLKLAYTAFTTVSQALAIFTAVSGAASGSIAKVAVVMGALAVGIGAAGMIEDMADKEKDAGDEADRTNDSLKAQQSQLDATAKKIANLNDKLEKLTRDYQRDLKEIAVKHEENLLTLNEQIEEANIDYRRAIDERMADFNVTLAKQERSHQETVDELMGQLSFLQRYNNDYNKQKLAQVQFALAKEQQLYQNETEKQRQEIELQNQADKEKLDAKLASLQRELDDEVAFMNKHRDALNSVRDVILLDEIESLKERYEEQKKSYQKQIEEAGKAGTDAGNSFKDAMDKVGFKQKGEEMGEAFIDGLLAGIDHKINGKGGTFDGWFGGISQRFYNLFNGLGFTDKKFNYVNGKWVESKKGYADGGYTGRGAPDEVAGIVHRGEFVLPASQVDQSTGTPKTGGDTFVFNLSGILATSAQAKRELAAELQAAMEQTKQARLA